MVSCSSSETEPPKPTANIEFEIDTLPLSIDYYEYEDYWYYSIYIVIYEKAGVGVNISVVTSEWFEGTNRVASMTDEGVRVPASGSESVYLYGEFPGRYQPDTFRITISGRDDNGHSIEKSHSYAITWDASMKVAKAG